MNRLEQLWRDEWGRLLALLVRQFRDVDLAEDALADAFEAAAGTWSASSEQAAIAGLHAIAVHAELTDWPRIARLYARLEQLTGSPVVRLNRAVAVAEADGPRSGLALLAGLDDALPRSHRLPAVRAELAARSGEPQLAREQYQLAIERCGHNGERIHLRARLAALG